MSKNSIVLTQEQRDYLERYVKRGQAPARSIQRAHILLKSDRGPQGPRWKQREIMEAFGVGETMIKTTCRRFLDLGLQEVLAHRRQPARPDKRKLDGEQEARLVTLACSPPPDGHESWTLRMLASRLMELEVVESVSHETVRQTLKKTR